MEKLSRAELIDTVNQQKEQLQQYKSKLRDVVAAYKSVVKEKEALEASLTALSACNSSSSLNKADIVSENTVETNEEEINTSDPLGATKQEPKDESLALREQVKTLSHSLATLTQEKNKNDAKFFAERKQVKHEIEELQAQLLEEKRRTSKQAEGFELQISDMKSRLRTQQLEREREQTDHALMLKELQTLLSKERSTKEALEAQIDEYQFALKDQRPQSTPVVSEVYEKQIQQLQNELQIVRDRLKSAENKANQPSPFIIELQKDMANMQADYQRQVEKEQQKATEAKHRLKAQAKQSEERISSLEAKLSDLSEVVGNYERLRFQDQQAISKLRERVTQLDLENTALVHAANLTPEKKENDLDTMEAEKIVEKIFQLRTILKNVAEKSETPVKLSSIFVEDMNKADEESDQCRKYKEELEQVKEDFERYKLRAQSVLKNKNKETGPSKECELLKEQVAELRDKFRMSNFHHQEEIAEYQNKIDNLSKALLSHEEKFKADLALVKASHQKEVVQLETESKKQRERTIAMLAEKDSEIQKLKALTGQGLDSDMLRHWSSGQQFFEGTLPAEDSKTKHSEEHEAVAQLLDLPKSLQNEAMFLHFAQEKGRMEVELNGLRKQKRQLESAIRDLQLSMSQKEEKLRDEISALQERLAEVDRHTHRESANVEYLKNVMVKFLTSTDSEGKKQMLKAVMTILQFSPSEKEMIKNAHARGWWPA
ncbi:GRIP and coiled-coil domain-containing protein 1-like [Biomphalaria glabrata]|uniref:GRIP and coiled-coil domain-containing protein 1-like n=1 Tax=Biomphalaria glabrata TaxID=6526 RepID=A0A9W2ZYK3_BIOGL|nr:GRIP and coiled-coil domain-containing protein 1-like [Biomphalaria glabrata]